MQALKTTIAGIDGNSLLSAVPTIVSDLKQIDTAWTALQQQIDQDYGWKTAAQSPSHSSLHSTFPRRLPVGR